MEEKLNQEGGELLELSEAIRDYHDNTLFPHMLLFVNVPVPEVYLLQHRIIPYATNPELSGLPPGRLLVPISTSPILRTLSTSESIDTEPFEELSSLSKSQSLSSTQQQELTVDNIEDFDDDDDLDEVDSRRLYFFLAIGDDDLRETTYEILLAAAGPSGYFRLFCFLAFCWRQCVSRWRFLEAMDVRTRLGLLNAMIREVGKRMDTILIPLELLCCISLTESRTEFSDKKSYIKWQKRQLNMLEGGAHKSSCYRVGESGRKANELRVLLPKIEESEQRCKGQCLKSLREIATPLAERPARGDLTGEVCHWADGYHLNVKLYENLLLSVFDVLDEGKLTEVSKTHLNVILSNSCHSCYALWCQDKDDHLVSYTGKKLKKFWSFLSPHGVIWESQKPSTTLAMLGYYFDRSSLSGFCLDFLVAARVGTRMEEVAVSSARLVPVRCPQQV
ncbi:hypothetical protein KY290_004005 [Solanum tuberosum]|uniref:Uncharacterized protein n=1 Tax=Solanum tuberosum TaxID=4113 RepID=A0ABQ7WUG7_SOLTU|nr:hypothetical protein KY289_002245 [Solanum tuberosum]KAH0784407.1 hypothetical protein KY290_004005 [Solanum tuberosum]